MSKVDLLCEFWYFLSSVLRLGITSRKHDHCFACSKAARKSSLSNWRLSFP